MEDLKVYIEERLWNSVKKNYLSDSYTNAVLDAIQFIGDTIRDKSGLDSDGAQLVGAAFGSESPKIRLSPLRTESERNFQKGIETILRGLYSAYRNPRSHSKIEDSAIDAFEVIIFVNHLLKIIDKSTGRFSIDIFLKRVLDKDFVPTEKYAELLIKDVPLNKRYEVMAEMYKARDELRIQNLRTVWVKMLKLLTEEQQRDLHVIASEDLRHVESLEGLIKFIGIFRDSWEAIDEDSRLRTENKLIKGLSSAEKTIRGQMNDHSVFCTWLSPILRKSILKTEIAEKIYELLNSGVESKQRFILDSFGQYLDELEPLLFLCSYKDVFKQELERGNGVIHAFVLKKYKGEYLEEFRERLENFTLIDNSDELPF